MGSTRTCLIVGTRNETNTYSNIAFVERRIIPENRGKTLSEQSGKPKNTKI